MTEVRTIYYDAEGEAVQDEAAAVHAIKVEVDEHGNTLRELEKWDIDGGPGSGYAGGHDRPVAS